MSHGVGLRVTLRLRMGAHDAHYAGELVDGARVLGLFGDVATELLVRLDGDEGLFRAYESVEFLAPVHAGDYLEVTGMVTRVGATSRQMAFEARKVVANLRQPGLAPSAADPLVDPQVVCRAVGTCVVPAGLQRRGQGGVPALPSGGFGVSAPGLPEGRAVITPAPTTIVTPPPSMIPPEVILTAAIVGAEITREQTPYLPLSADEIAAEAARCAEAGAAVVHLHVRTPEGRPSQATELFAEAIARVRERADVIVQVSTGGAVGMSIDERCGPLACKPEMATLNCGSVNFGDDVFVNTRPQIRDIAGRIHASGAVAELECYEVGHLDEALSLAREGILRGPLHVQFVLGVPGGMAASDEGLAFLVTRLPSGASWGCAAVGRHQRPMTELAMRLGGHARVGLEDNIYLEKGVLAEGSAPLVARAASYARSIGRTPVDAARARALLLG